MEKPGGCLSPFSGTLRHTSGLSLSALSVPSPHAGFLSFTELTSPQFQQPAETNLPLLVIMLNSWEAEIHWDQSGS